MKRVLSLAAAAAMLLSLAACGCSAKAGATGSGVSGSVSGGTSSSEPQGGSGYRPEDLRVGLGVVSTTSESSAASGETAGSAAFTATICALCLDAENTIVDVRFDTVKTALGFDVSGAFTGDINADIMTKRELGDDYGLKTASGIGKEWYEQVDALEDWMRGMTVGDALGMRLNDSDPNHPGVPDEEQLKSAVTISVTDQLRALEKAYADATGNAGGSGSGSSSSDAGSNAGSDAAA